MSNDDPSMTFSAPIVKAARELTDRFPFKPFSDEQVVDTCEVIQSALHENYRSMRAELDDMQDGIAAMTNEVASVLMLMDELATVWGDEGVFRRCRDRLRALVPKCPSCGGHGICSGEATGLVCGACNGTGIESDEVID